MCIESKDIIYLFWKGNTEEEYKVGKLWRRENKYYFKYIVEEVKRAMENGFQLLEGFPRMDAEYFKEELFAAFSKNINTKGKEEITDEFEVLKNLNLNEEKREFYFKS